MFISNELSQKLQGIAAVVAIAASFGAIIYHFAVMDNNVEDISSKTSNNNIQIESLTNATKKLNIEIELLRKDVNSANVNIDRIHSDIRSTRTQLASYTNQLISALSEQINKKE